jgi:hypothetical protein
MHGPGVVEVVLVAQDQGETVEAGGGVGWSKPRRASEMARQSGVSSWHIG